MELFYSKSIFDGKGVLSEEESSHCVRVLRHKIGDMINVIDGLGTFYECRITRTGKNTDFEVVSVVPSFGAHEYKLEMAVAPTKNMDRYEWFLEKSTEFGVDDIFPVIGEHSERKIIKSDRCNKILLSAAKQSLKGAVPVLHEACSVTDFISYPHKDLRIIAYCGEADKTSITGALSEYKAGLTSGDYPHITILIGPEGDFSREEAALAIKNGFVPVHLGESRLRTETAAVAAVSAVYFTFIK
ncbi:MAG: 16S rRNA (uracil(1498)-N(3))-methyltransferase [Bacteroidales bacterium]|jgi:16S rRNA (uracil1498-N3)-methyltransferase|nr:16S rRNA (uracil(1498)-N(3))-methyltransferase [Bacteroidales bacterium]